MKKTRNSVKLDSIIKDYKLIEENIFIGRIADIAKEDKELVISRIQSLLKDRKIGIHLKYLIIKIIGTLKFQIFISLLSSLLYEEEKDRIINEILNSLTNIICIESYKVVTSFFSEPKNIKLLPKFMGYLKLFYTRSPLIYHFDLFYRDRGEVKNIEVSSNFLIDNLQEPYLKDLLPAIFSKYKIISFEALKLFERKPSSLFYNCINEIFLEKHKDEEDIYFKQIVRTLFNNASVSPHKKKIFVKLRGQMKLLSKKRKNYFMIFLLKLDTNEILDEALNIYKELDIDEKLLFFINLDPAIYPVYKEFIKSNFIKETDEKILLRMISIFIKSNEYDLLFKITADQIGTRKGKLLNLIIETGTKNLSYYFSKFILTTEKDTILLIAIGYIMTDCPDAHYDIIQKTLFSGVDLRIKQRIIRNIKNFNNKNIRKILKKILNKTIILNAIEKDFLLMIITLQEKDIIDAPLKEKLLNRILQMMEETDLKDIVNFIYFFDSFSVNTPEQKTLIIDELKMIQITLLKSPKNDNLVSMIYKLIKKIDI